MKNILDEFHIRLYDFLCRRHRKLLQLGAPERPDQAGCSVTRVTQPHREGGTTVSMDHLNERSSDGYKEECIKKNSEDFISNHLIKVFYLKANHTGWIYRQRCTEIPKGITTSF